METPYTVTLPADVSPELKTALKEFLANVAQHSRKNSELIDVLVQAMKSVNQDLQQEKLRTHLLEARLQQTEARLEAMGRTVEALRRQGWVQ
jgi:cell division protein ZapA (FtsZ GTPase activity inhibitor)